MTVRGLVARRARVVLTVVSIVIGVSFVSGAFILTDSFRRSFDELFARLDQGIDLRVRGETAFGSGGGGSPVPSDLADQIAAITGVVAVEPSLDEPAVILDTAGVPVPARGGPQLGISWTGGTEIGGRIVRTGRIPSGIDEVAIDETTADRIDLRVGDQVRVAVASGIRSFTIVGTIGMGGDDDVVASRATIAAFDPITAQVVLDSPGLYDSIDIAVAEGAAADVTSAIEAILPPGTEVATGADVARETSERVGNAVDLLRWVLLGFALIALFVSAFLINNTFRIIVGQRIRELALLRAVGAGGAQVQRLILAESALIAVVSTALGLLGGVGVSEVMTRVFNAGGVGFPDARTIVAGRTVVVAVAVGVGVTLLATLAPARTARRVPPIAALRPELAPPAVTARRRWLAGGVCTAVGVAVFAFGVLARPGELSTVVALVAGGGALVLVGAAVLAVGVAGRVAGALGAPVERLLRMPGRLARENAVRSPRRTATTASALMIGIALVSGVGVVGASLGRSLSEQLGQSITADFFLSSSTRGFSPLITAELAALPELGAVSGFRSGNFEIDGDARSVGAVDGADFAEIVDLGLTAGGYDGLADDGLLVHRDPANDRSLEVGDSVDVRWRSGTEQRLTVVGIFTDSSVIGANWVVDTAVFEAANPAARLDLFAGAAIADGVGVDAARAAIETAMADHPQIDVQDQAEFLQAQEDQLDQLLRLVYGLLAFAVLIAVLGITNTLALAVFERTHEFGLLRAIGATRRQLQLVVFGESMIVAAFGTTLGLVVGLPLGALGTRGLRTAGVTSIVFPAGTIAVVVAATLVAGIAAAVWPARRAARLDVLDAIAEPG